MIKTRDITWFKYHLLYSNLNSNTKKCLIVPPKVKQDIRELLHQKSKSKAKKVVAIHEI